MCASHVLKVVPYIALVAVYPAYALLQIASGMFLKFHQPKSWTIWIILPPVLVLGHVTAICYDYFARTTYSVRAMAALAIPLVARLIPKLKYDKLCVHPIALSACLIATELMMLLNVFMGYIQNQYFYIILPLAIYYIIALILSIWYFIKPLFHLIKGVFTCFKEFKLRQNLVTLFNAFDIVVAGSLVLTLTSMIFIFERSRNISLNSYTVRLDQYVEMLRWVFNIATLVALGYSLLRFLFLYFLTAFAKLSKTRTPTQAQAPTTLPVPLSQVSVENLHNNPITTTRLQLPLREATSTAHHREPQNSNAYPEPPSTSYPRAQVRRPTRSSNQGSNVDQFLDLFRISANYYVDAEDWHDLNDQHRPASSDDDICLMCCDRPSTCIVMNCRHGGLCRTCATQLRDRDARRRLKCPFCSLPIERICVVAEVGESSYKIVAHKNIN